MKTAGGLRSWRLVVLLLALLTWAGAACADQAMPAAEVPAVQPAAGKVYLWAVSAAGKPPTYVLGSLHAAKPEIYPLPEVIEQAYAHSERLVVEVDITDQPAMAEVMRKANYVPPDSLDQHLKPASWKRLEDLMQAAHSDTVQLKPLRAAVLAEGISMGALAARGYDLKAGIDLHFLKQAHASDKPIEQLETLEFQIGMLTGLSDQDSDAYLNEALDDLRDGKAFRVVDRMLAAWKAGDADALGRAMTEDGKESELSRRLSRTMLTERNAGMADRIAAYAQAGRPTFVVVGAGHLAGEGGVLERLRTQGLEVRQLP